MPTATDLVTDLPADFEVFGQAVATSMADLLGGASGYILSKASATDMDFAWIANDQGDITGVTAGTGISGGGTSGTVTVTNSMATAIDAKGDLIGGTGADAFSRLAVGTNGTVLTADSAEATGLKWATPANGLTLVKTQTIGSAVSSVTVTSAFSATYDNYLINVSGGVASTDNNIEMTIGAAATGYVYNNLYMLYTGTTITGENSNSQVKWIRVGRGSANSIDCEITLKNPFNTKRTTGQWRTSSAGAGQMWSIGGGALDDNTSYTAFTLTAATGTLTGGTIRVYGYQNS